MTQTAEPPPRHTPASSWQLELPAFAATVVAYVAAGLVALLLTIAPAGTSPLYPAAGIALASVLVQGWRMLGAVALGSLSVNLISLSLHGAGDHRVATAAVVATGAVLQAALGAALIRRYVRQPLVLTLPADVARFMAACLGASLVAPTIGALALSLFSALPPGGAVWHWTTSWIGDLAGLLIVTPIALTIFGRPASEWRPRRVSVGVTLSVVVVFLALGIVQLGRWNDERVREAFEHDASSASLMLATQMQEPLRALEALHDVFTVSHQIGGAEVRRISQHWLNGTSVRAIGWSERVHHDDIAAFEARARADGALGYRIYDRPAVPGARPVAPVASLESDLGLGLRGDGGDVIAIRFVEPSEMNGAALGLNAVSIPTGGAAALIAAVDSGAPAVSTGFQMTPEGDGEAQPGVLLYQAVYDGDPVPPGQRRSAFRGLVFVVSSLDRQLASMAGRVPAYLDLCVVDATPGGSPRRLGGRPGCDTGTPELLHDRPIVFAGHPWDLRISARPDAVPDANDRSAWIFSAAGLLSAALLGASLLITTGRTRRIESAVRDRTAALRAEVGERHAAEAALRASEERFRNILDHVPIGIVYAGLDGRMIQANPRFCELTGYSEAELVALSPADLTDPDDLAHDQALTAELVSEKIPMYRRHRRYITKKGDVVWVRATVTLLRDSAQQPWRIVGVVEDITEHLRLEEAERAREAAEAANVAKSEFLSRMSHELRTPLNAMLGFAQLLEIDKRQPLSPVQRPWVAQIQQAGWHLLEMINDVLDLSRIESGNLRLQITALELPELVAATVALVGSEAVRRNVRISQDLGPGTAGILGDPTRVKQILTNLLSNAVKYNVDGGRVHVASRLTAADRVEISVTDTGMGMTAEQMSGLFKPFNRLGRERSALQGTGIGLVISRRLAELMGGSITVRSLPGEGSSFTLRLPKSIDPDTVPSPLDALETGPAEYHRRIVHYIEDNETNVEVMRGILSQRPQVQMEVSVTGLDGLAAVRARRPHLILLDMHLPDINGLELLRHLKSDPGTAGVPVMIVSADALAPQIDAALAAGASRYLTKPVDVAELLGALDDLLDRMDTGFS
ncbi:MAG TPA: PAS domain S-box protein [Caldimonas sp.]|nr:PAS domain S-box protein [Caldimonas sp.]